MPTANDEMFAIYKQHAALLLREASLERDLATQVRHAISERLLRETDRPLIQVAYEVGYGSQSTFTRAMRRWLDASPRAYRQRFRDFEREQLNGKRAHGTGVHVSNGD
jgi:AraC-like DNA-binding protein